MCHGLFTLALRKYEARTLNPSIMQQGEWLMCHSHALVNLLLVKEHILPYHWTLKFACVMVNIFIWKYLLTQEYFVNYDFDSGKNNPWQWACTPYFPYLALNRFRVNHINRIRPLYKRHQDIWGAHKDTLFEVFFATTLCYVFLSFIGDDLVSVLSLKESFRVWHLWVTSEDTSCSIFMKLLILFYSMLYPSTAGSIPPPEYTTFSVLCYPCLYSSLLPHNVISPMTFWSSGWSYTLYLPLCASDTHLLPFHTGDVSSPFSFHILDSFVCIVSHITLRQTLEVLKSNSITEHCSLQKQQTWHKVMVTFPLE